MRSIVQSLRENKFEETRTTTQEAVESHILAFAAEEARQKGTIISIKDRC
jgi:hypothetical protein